MAAMHQSLFDPAIRPEGWAAHPMEAGHEARASQRSRSHREREEEVSTSCDESEDEKVKAKGKGKAKAKAKKRKRQPVKKMEAKRGGGGGGTRKGVGSKSGDMHRRTAGASDDEISSLPEAVKHAAEPRLSAAQLKAAKQKMKAPISEGEETDEDEDEDEDEDGGPRGLTADEKLQAVEWLTTPEHYKNLHTSLETYCITVSKPTCI